VTPLAGAARPARRAAAGALGRIGLIAFGLLLVLAIEGALALLGLGGARDRGDPFLGFSDEYAIFVRDERSGMMTTDPAKRESFNVQTFSARKPAGTVRIFCLGGSDTYGFPRGAAEAYPALLAEKLARAFPERRVEVVNVGGLSYAAYRCVNVLREVSRYEPDACVYLGGNNEYVERRFFASLLAEPAWRRSLRARLSRLRTYTLLRKLILPATRRGGAEGAARDLFGTRVVRDDSEPMPRSDAEDGAIEASFRASLTQMAEIAREARVLFVLGVPAVNQADWPPDLSLHDPSLALDALRAFDERLAEGKRLRGDGAIAEATRAFAAAAAIDPRHAEAHYRLGACYHALGRSDSARIEYNAAIAADATPIRATPRLQETIRSVAAATGATLVDAAALFAEQSEGGLVGRRLMLDYCHPTLEGHERIADALFAALAGPLFGAAGAAPPALAPGLADRGEARSAFGTTWEGQMLVRQGRFDEAAARFEEALALEPRFALALEGLGRCRAARGDIAGALDLYERAAAADPTSATILANLGGVYLAAGRLEDAAAALRRAVDADPTDAGGRIQLAKVLGRLGRRSDARAELEAAIAANPTRVEAHRLLGGLLAALGDTLAAEARYREAVRLNPSDVALAYDHALLVQHLGRTDEALAAFERIVARDPSFYQAVGAIGLIALQRDDRERAAAQFRRVLALRPDDPLAARYLAALEGRATPR
jgi:tetratricopeptide (TPR) repeat protein